MPVTELLFSGDTTEQGRVIINNAYGQDCIWTGSTGDFTGITKNIITNNDGNNIISGNSATNSSVVEYSSILAGLGNTIFGQNPFNTSVKNSSIIGGNSNLITQNNGFVDIENCVIVGGQNNAITGTSDISNTVIIGGQGLTGDTSDRVYVENIQSFGARIRNLSRKTINIGDWMDIGAIPPIGFPQINSGDELCFLINANYLSRPDPTYFNFEVGRFIFSKIGTVIDVVMLKTVTGGFFGSKNVFIGLGVAGASGDVYINGTSIALVPLQICPTSGTSVRFVVVDRIGTDTYVEMYGTGA